MQVATIDASGIPEGLYGTALAGVAAARAGVMIGSYPSFPTASSATRSSHAARTPRRSPRRATLSRPCWLRSART